MGSVLAHTMDADKWGPNGNDGPLREGRNQTKFLRAGVWHIAILFPPPLERDVSYRDTLHDTVFPGGDLDEVEQEAFLEDPKGFGHPLRQQLRGGKYHQGKSRVLAWRSFVVYDDAQLKVARR